ncbi:hypothetical protein LCGC14_2861540 [marine sediment metagenome]|uniref:Uncharacterized protein n=1 Tax=marine sediment metagenome TaxID=412755 RepID=A0A0F9ADS6_9ZZZZ
MTLLLGVIDSTLRRLYAGIVAVMLLPMYGFFGGVIGFILSIPLLIALATFGPTDLLATRIVAVGFMGGGALLLWAFCTKNFLRAVITGDDVERLDDWTGWNDIRGR